MSHQESGKEAITFNYNISIPKMVADLNLLNSDLKHSELGTYQLGFLADNNSKYCLSKLACVSDDYGFSQMEPQNSIQKVNISSIFTNVWNYLAC